MTSLGETLEALADSEQRFVDIVRDVAALYNAGVLQPRDIALYDAARVSLYTAQMVAYGVFVSQVRSHLPDPVAAIIPVPTMASPIPAAARTATLARAGTAGLRARGIHGLGVAPVVIAIGAFEATIPLWAVVIIALAAVMAICYAVSVTANTVTSIARLDQQLTALRNYYDTQLTAARNCLATGRSATDCAALVAAIQPPSTALPAEGPPPGGDPNDWMSKFLIGAGVVFGGLIVLTVLPTVMRAWVPGSSGGGGGGRTYRLVEG